jgi:hypothetical protein
MEILVKGLTEKGIENNDYDDIFSMFVDGKNKMVVSGGEPEDNILSRDLNFVYDIPNLMKTAWEAGKRGEEFEIKYENYDNTEDVW